MSPGRALAVAIPATAALVLATLAWLRGPQPEHGAPPPGSADTAAELLAATGALLAGDPDAEAAGPGPDVGRETWYVSVYRDGRRRPVTVRVRGAMEDWAAPLRRAWPGRLQVDLAIEPAPRSPTAFGGLGLDVGLDGWIEEGGAVHLPVEFLLDGMRRGELAEFLREHPGRPLRTFAWVETSSGPARMLRHSVDPGELTPALLRERCDLGGDYLAAHLNRNHKYDYEWNAREGRREKGYNLLRHAGTTYSLFQLYNHTGREAHYRAAAEALLWLEDRRATSEIDPARCFEVESNKVKLGGAGLTLLALVEQARARPEDADLEWMRCLAEHIVQETDERGAMASFYTDGGRYKWSSHRSIYYPGEALLGLVRLYEIDPDPRWQQTAVRAAEYLVHDRWTALGMELQVPPDAWLIQALEVLHRQVPDEAFADYAFEIAEQLTRPQLRGDRVPEDLYGGRVATRFPHVISTGSRGEGMAAAARLERRLRPGETHYLDRLRANSRYALRNQYTEPTLLGLRRPDRALGGFRNAPDDPAIRIDGVQHNLSGLLGLLELLEDGGTP